MQVARSGRLPRSASALERAGKQPPAVLSLWARAKAIPGEARLALNRLPTRCSSHYYLDRVPGCNRQLDEFVAMQVPTVTFHIGLLDVITTFGDKYRYSPGSAAADSLRNSFWVDSD